MVTKKYIISVCCALCFLSGCSKIEPTGILIGNTNVDDRVKQSYYFYSQEENKKSTFEIDTSGKEYSFLVIADSHTTTDMKRLTGAFDETLKGGHLFCAHLGDLAETQPEYYADVEDLVTEYKEKGLIFYPVVGNHDITRNGWALFNDIFGTSTYFVEVYIEGREDLADLFVFLDTANGTLGKRQMQDILPIVEEIRQDYRHCFVFTHNPFFRPRSNAYSSNFPREELYYLFDFFAENKIDYVFSGHIHAHGENTFRGVQYITLDAFSERNNPIRGEIAKITCKANGDIQYELIYVP